MEAIDVFNGFWGMLAPYRNKERFVRHRLVRVLIMLLVRGKLPIVMRALVLLFSEKELNGYYPGINSQPDRVAQRQRSGNRKNFACRLSRVETDGAPLPGERAW